MCVIIRVPLRVAAENTICQCACCAVERRRIQPLCARTKRRIGALYDGFHALRGKICKRWEQQAQQRDFHIIPEQQADVAHEHDARIEYLGREFTHALRAGIDI